jgi:CheY-like chemotaxis protein
VHLRAKDAIQVAKEMSSDLVLLDVMLGDGIGYQVARGLRSDPLLYRVAILFQSVLGDQHEVNHAYSEGGDGYISKPYTMSDLSSGIDSMNRLTAEIRRICSETSMRSLAHLRREIDHRLFREESLALFYLYYDCSQPEDGKLSTAALQEATARIAATIGKVGKSAAFYETSACHMGGGFFMVLTNIEDRARFKKYLIDELAEFTPQLSTGHNNGRPLKIYVDSIHTDEFQYTNASEMFTALKEPRLKTPRRKRRPSRKPNFDSWLG